MKGLANGLLVAAAFCVVIGVISRYSQQPVKGVEAQAFLNLAQTLLLAVIALSVMKK